MVFLDCCVSLFFLVSFTFLFLWFKNVNEKYEFFYFYFKLIYFLCFQIMFFIKINFLKKYIILIYLLKKLL
jgi:hypothetical protein